MISALAALASIAALPLPVLAISLQTTNGETPAQVAGAELARPALLSWGDWNADSRLDFVALGVDGLPRLFEAGVDGAFTDVSLTSGLANRVGVQAAIWLDFNSDQLPDLFLLVPGGHSALMENIGVGFVDASDRSGLALTPGLVFAQALDFDADARMDLLLSSEFELRLYRNLGASFEGVTIALPNNTAPLTLLAQAPDSETSTSTDVNGAASSDGRRSGASRTAAAPAASGSTGPARRALTAEFDLSNPGSSLPMLAACPPRVEDTGVAGTCLQASSVATLGRLYPLSTNLFVDAATGFVGINDLTPSFRLDVTVGGATAAAVRGVGLFPPTSGYAGVQGTLDFDGVPSADWSGLEIGLVGISAAASIADNYGVMGHSNNVGVRGEHATAPTTDFGELGLAGVGIHASGATAAGEFDGSVNVRDGDGDMSAALIPSVDGLSSDLRLYRDGILVIENVTSPTGKVSRYRDSTTGAFVIATGSSFADGAGFFNASSTAGVSTVVIDGDSDNVANATTNGEITIRSLGTGGPGGQLNIQNNDGGTRIQATGGSSADGGVMTFYNSIGDPMWAIDGEAGTGGTIVGTNDAGANSVILDSDSGGGGLVSVSNGVSGTRLSLDGDGGDDGGMITILATDASSTVVGDGQAENDGGAISVRNDVSGETVRIVGDRALTGGGSNSGLISMFDRNGTVQNSILLEAEDDFSTGSQIRLEGATAGVTTIELDGSDASVGQLDINEADGSLAFRMFNTSFTLHNAAGTATQTYNRITGTKSAVVPTDSYGHRLLYCVESPEIWFEDLGSGQLAAGSARVDLDPMFLETVTINAQYPMKVFVTLTGDCNGVWIEKHGRLFVVHELAGGSSNATFDYRIMAKRRGTENLRLDSWEAELAEMSKNADPKSTRPQPMPQDGSETVVEPEIRKRDAQPIKTTNGALDAGTSASKGPVRGSEAPFKKGARPVVHETPAPAPVVGGQR